MLYEGLEHLWSGGLGWWFPFLNRGSGECIPTIVVSHFSTCLGKFTLECWMGASDLLWNLGVRSSVASVQVLEQWTKSLELLGGPGAEGMGVFLSSLHVLWIW